MHLDKDKQKKKWLLWWNCIQTHSHSREVYEPHCIAYTIWSKQPYYAFLTILYAELVIKAMDILSGNNHTLTDIYALTLSHIIHICICMDGVLWVRTWQPLVLCSSATHTAHSVRGEWRHRRLDCNQCNEWVRGSNTDKHKHQTEAIKRYDIMKVGGGSMNSEQLSQCYRNGIEVVLLILRFSCLLESDIAIFCTIIKLCDSTKFFQSFSRLNLIFTYSEVKRIFLYSE